MNKPYTVTIKGVKAVRELCGMPLVDALEQVRALVTLANNDTLLPGVVLMDTNRGFVPLSELYAAAGVAE